MLLLDEDRATEAVAPLERALHLLPRPAAEYGDGKKAITQLGLARALWLASDDEADGDHGEGDRERARVLAREAIDLLEHDPAAQSGVLARDLERVRGWVGEHLQ